MALSALCQASHVFKLAAPPLLSNLVAKSSTIHSTGYEPGFCALKLIDDFLMCIRICHVVTKASYRASSSRRDILTEALHRADYIEEV